MKHPILPLESLDEGNASSLDKGLRLLTAVILDRGQVNLSTLADELAIPQSTARRLMSTFQKHGFVLRAERGRYVPGGMLRKLGLAIDEHELLRRVARPCVRRCAAELRATVHLGILVSGMVTYLIKEHAGTQAGFSREGGALEAYCSGVGKVLLAQLPYKQIKEYLSEGPFIALTANTITEPRALLRELKRVSRQGFSIDDGEFSDDIFCVAVPLELATGFSQVAGLSVTLQCRPSSREVVTYADALRRCAAEIRSRIA
ncbi:IclR family transcriptional regulator [Paraburkholderia sp. CNPSo 3076]|uniref:IclR family transcriptional regulator n=1 Tax=Paraburkholderia sp. CNPSo 3076 TaxID=2940936 RepID=UPI0022595FF5|nr:IclR family transcriptional regulator [Paraburkholderia sp. CNPSo 3076]MCX5542116.1 IclR family transcriptional regulator [Paraburkholderia sp. CNPSo 3076]